MSAALIRACVAAASHIKLAAAAVGLVAITTGATVAIVVVGSREVTPPAPTYRADAGGNPSTSAPQTPTVVVPPTNPGQTTGETPVQPQVNDIIVPNDNGGTGNGGTGNGTAGNGGTQVGNNTGGTGGTSGSNGVIPVGNPSQPSQPGGGSTPSQPAPPPPIIDTPVPPTGNHGNPPVVVPTPKPPMPAVSPVCVRSNDRYDVYRLTIGGKDLWFTVRHDFGKIGKGCPPIQDHHSHGSHHHHQHHDWGDSHHGKHDHQASRNDSRHHCGDSNGRKT